MGSEKRGYGRNNSMDRVKKGRNHDKGVIHFIDVSDAGMLGSR